MSKQDRQAAMTRIATSQWAMRPECISGILRAATIQSEGNVRIMEDAPKLEATIFEYGIYEEMGVACLDSLEDMAAWPDSAGPRLPKANGSVAVLPVRGVIGQHRGGDYWADVYADELGAVISGLVANDSVGAVVLDIDSPGGIVYGTPELAETVRAARDVKPIYGLANGMAASAAFWLGAQATKFFSTPSSEVGSVGVWSAHVNAAQAYEQEGLDVTLVSAGKYKVEGNSFGPLTDEARADMQASVDRYYGMFVSDLAKGRGVSTGTVKSDFGQGRMLGADAAKAAGMIDGIATLPELMGAILKPRQKEGRSRSLAASIAIEEAYE